MLSIHEVLLYNVDTRTALVLASQIDSTLYCYGGGSDTDGERSIEVLLQMSTGVHCTCTLGAGVAAVFTQHPPGICRPSLEAEDCGCFIPIH